MGWSGGTYTKGNAGSGGWTGDASLGIGIEASRHDTQDNDFATGINTCLTKDGQNTPTANLPMGGYKHTGVGNATAADQYLSYGQLLDVTKAVLSAGTAPNYTVTLTPAPSAYFQGMAFDMICHSSTTSTGVHTLNVNGLGAKDLKIVTSGSSRRDVEPYELSARQVYRVVYESTLDSFQIINPTFGGYIGTTFTPSISSGSGSTAVINSGTCRYTYIGSNLVFVFYNLNIGLSGATSGVISLSLPVNAASNMIAQSLQGGFVATVAGYSNYGALPFVQNATTIQVYRNDQTAFPIDSSMFIRINGIYQAA